MPAAKWTPEQKTTALDLYREHGPAEAARRTGIPLGTISSWAKRSGVQTAAPENARVRVEAAKIKWAERRLTIADEFGTAIVEFLAAGRKAAADGDGRNTQAFATAAAISLDKAQLVTGGPTERTEHEVTDPQRRLAVVTELAAKVRPAEGQAAG